MLFLLNETVFNLDSVALAPPVSATRFEKLSLRFVGQLGAEMFAKDPLLHLTSPERASRLAALIVAKAPEINAALGICVLGNKVIVSRSPDIFVLTDTKGGVAHVTIGDVMQSNGVIHVVDKVLMPS